MTKRQENERRIVRLVAYAKRRGFKLLDYLYCPPPPAKDTPLAAIKAHCTHCLGETWDTRTGEVFSDGFTPRTCTQKNCALYPYRTGRGPSSGRMASLTPEQRKDIGKRLKAGRDAKG